MPVKINNINKNFVKFNGLYKKTTCVASIFLGHSDSVRLMICVYAVPLNP